MLLHFHSLPLMAVLICAVLSGCTQKEDLIRGSSSTSFTEVIETVSDSQLKAEKTPLTLPATVAII